MSRPPPRISTAPTTSAAPPPPPPRPVPVVFGPDARPLAGFVHHAEPALRRDTGLVIVNPFGYEAVCAHRSLRHLAEASARAGVAALRYDHDGTGDSAGGDTDPGRVAASIAGVGHAVRALRATAGVDRVVLAGVRLGGLLAACAALELEGGVDAVALLAPVSVGRTYLRELKAFQLALGLPPPPPGAPPQGDEQEAVGFLLSAETRAALGALDLGALTRAPAPRVLLVNRDDLPAQPRLAERLAALGAQVTHERLPGYVEMMLDPHKAQVPRAILDATVTFAAHGSAAARTPAPAPAAPAQASLSDGVVERPLYLGTGDDRRLFGVLTSPPPGTPARSALLLANPGAVHHVGVNRLHVTLARRWAARGHTVLRLDLGGLGDSAPAPGGTENEVYPAAALDDLAQGVAALARHPGGDRLTVIGLCAGAYHAFKAAVTGQAVRRVVCINPLTFFWKPGLDLEFPAHRVAADAARYRDSVRSAAAWRKLLRGDVKLERVAQVVARAAAARAGKRVRDVARSLGRPLADDLGAEPETAARRGVDLCFVFAAGEPGLELLATQGGAAMRRLRGRGQLRVTVLDGPDHTFTPIASHERLAKALDAFLVD